MGQGFQSPENCWSYICHFIFLLFVGFHGLAEHFSGSFNLTSNVNKAVRSETLGWMGRYTYTALVKVLRLTLIFTI